MKHPVTRLMPWLLALSAWLAAPAAQAAVQKTPEDLVTGHKCVQCHANETPGLVAEWKKSGHFGKEVDCYTCHKAQPGDKDAYTHHKATIRTVVTPRTCATCHEKEVAQQQRSHHAKAGEILASLDNLLGEVLGGPQAVNAGCRQCHGSEVKLDAKGMPTADTWPNTGIGRINPDGSKGSCSACHARHRFASMQARQPDTCGKCHLGPDHPQKEIYEESKHGILYKAFQNEMHMDLKKWVVGQDYSAAPTCATCHMGATPTQSATHDVGERISWTLRPAISSKINLVRLENGDQFDLPASQPLPHVGQEMKGSKVKSILTWEQRREKMKDVCINCHTDRQVDNHYQQFDDVVHLYNEKFAKPIAAVMGELVKGGYLTKAPFDEKIEWTWWEIWHHQGRRARHGAAMSGPDYAWWHGMYEVAKDTYMEWIPELREVVKKKDGNEKFADALLEKYFKPIPGHDWLFNGLNPESLEKMRKGIEERYGKGALK